MKPAIAPRCGPCGKAVFQTEDAATSAALTQAARHGTPFSVYWCEPGQTWHITTTHDRSVSHVGTVAPAAAAAESHAGAGFITAAPLIQARRFAEAEIRGQQTAAELAWLHAEPLLWLRALSALLQQSQTATAKARCRLADLKPLSGRNPTAAYLAAKADFDKKTLGRLRFEQVIRGRIDEVRSLLGNRPINSWVTAGDLTEMYVRIAALIDEGDVEAARDLALRNAERWGRRPVDATPDVEADAA